MVVTRLGEMSHAYKSQILGKTLVQGQARLKARETLSKPII
jgi:hypothetical protein